MIKSRPLTFVMYVFGALALERILGEERERVSEGRGRRPEGFNMGRHVDR